MSTLFNVWQGPGQIDLRVESFMKMFETTLYKLSGEDFKVNSLHYDFSMENEIFGGCLHNEELFLF